MKMKIKPSAKMKRRYLLIEGSKKNVEKAILDYVGILGWTKASPFFVKTAKTSKLVLAVNRKEVNNIRAAFEVAEEKIKVLKVSGTMKGLLK